MSLGLGHRYFVHVIKSYFGNLESCIKFINDNRPKNKTQWYELRPIPDLKKETCDYYNCSLVEIAK